MARSVKVGITHGDFNGVGYEIILRTLGTEGVTELYTPVAFADMRLVERAAKSLGIQLDNWQSVASAAEAREGRVNVVDLRLDDIKIEPGVPTSASGKGAVAALEKGVEALEAGEIDVLVTAPISKQACHSDSFPYPGHTEFLEARAGEEDKAQMILFEGPLRIALVTTHLPLSEVPGAVTTGKILDSLRAFNRTLRRDFGIPRPKIAVMSLNPHCGDGGLLGEEETTTIIPAIAEAEKEGILAFGPFASDGLFGSRAYEHYDGILAMYHDQGLAPFKALARRGGVNFTAGLPWVRTSPDHGTAYDIAWKGEADPDSMREAIYEAIDILRRRRIFDRASSNPLRKSRHEKGGGDKNADLSKDENAVTPDQGPNGTK